MSLTYPAALVAAVYLNLIALTLVVLRGVPSPGIARAAGVVGGCVYLFFIEHFIGLGSLRWVLPPLTAAAAFIVWRRRAAFLSRDFLIAELVFLLAVAYGLAWRWTFPEIVESFDQLTDLHLIANYLPGERLPPADFWIPGQRLDYYYTLQHYGAALLGRMVDFGPGASFNFALVLVAALVIGLAWAFLEALDLGLPAKALAIACLAIGGTGISPLFHLITAPTDADLWSARSAWYAIVHNQRFVGWFGDAVASDFWRGLAGVSMPSPLHLPIETLGQQYVLGAYHAPLAGFLMLFLALASIAALQRSDAARPGLEVLLGLTVPLTLSANAWVLPLQAILVGAWTLWDRGIPRPRDLRFLAAGAAAGVVLLLPFLVGFAGSGRPVTLTRVLAGERTPLAQFLIVHWPLLLAALLAPVVGRRRSLAMLFVTIFVPLVLGTELLNAFDGGYGGDLLRFNPALKWWSWTFTGGFFAISTCLLASERRVVRAAAVLTLLLVSLLSFDLARYWISREKPYAGQLAGDGFYARDPANAQMLSYLVNADKGVVLEKVYEERPIDTGIYGSFSVKPNVVGIPWVLGVWNRDLSGLPDLVADVASFYRGRHAAPLDFLRAWDVRYVVWSQRESQDLQAWASIDRTIAGRYLWIEFSPTADRHVGLWIRRA